MTALTELKPTVINVAHPFSKLNRTNSVSCFPNRNQTKHFKNETKLIGWIWTEPTCTRTVVHIEGIVVNKWSQKRSYYYTITVRTQKTYHTTVTLPLKSKKPTYLCPCALGTTAVVIVTTLEREEEEEERSLSLLTLALHSHRGFQISRRFLPPQAIFILP